MTTSPLFGLSRSPIMWSRVDLPAPEGPMMAMNSPFRMRRFIFFSTSKEPYFPMLYVFFRSFRVSISSMALLKFHSLILRNNFHPDISPTQVNFFPTCVKKFRPRRAIGFFPRARYHFAKTGNAHRSSTMNTQGDPALFSYISNRRYADNHHRFSPNLLFRVFVRVWYAAV